MSIIKHTVILKTGFHFSFMHAKPIEWEHVRAKDARSETDINRRNIYGNVVLIKQPYL